MAGTQVAPDGLFAFSAAQGLVALAGGGQTGATLLPMYVNEVSTVVTAADSVMLPLAAPGAVVFVINDTATSMQVFGQPSNPNNSGVGDTIAAHGSAAQSATATGVAQAATIMACYVCFVVGKWKQMITA